MDWHERADEGRIRTTLVSGEYRVREYQNRLAIWRCDGNRLGWEELQRVKTVLWGNKTAIEVYPPQRDVVNLRHTRHLWWSPELESVVRRECQHPEFTPPRG